MHMFYFSYGLLGHLLLLPFPVKQNDILVVYLEKHRLIQRRQTRQVDRQTDKQTDKQTGKRIDKLTGWRTDGQNDTDTNLYNKYNTIQRLCYRSWQPHLGKYRTHMGLSCTCSGTSSSGIWSSPGHERLGDAEPDLERGESDPSLVRTRFSRPRPCPPLRASMLVFKL